MSVSESVRLALTKGRVKQKQLALRLGFTSQAVHLKLVKERWTGAELAKVAELTGGKLVFLYPDGDMIQIRVPEDRPAEGEEV